MYIFFWSTIATVINSFLFSAPYAFPFLESKYFVATILAVDGVALSGTFVPVYLILEHIVMSSGFRYSEDSLKLVIGIWINFTMAGKNIKKYGSFPFEPPPPKLKWVRIICPPPPQTPAPYFYILVYYVMTRALYRGGGGA